MDIKGFFDSLSHSWLIHLMYHFGFSSKICLWIKSFLSNWNIAFIINGTTSNSIFLDNVGIPQGSPISPILSVIYTSLTLSAFRISNTVAFSYIDDICVLCHYSSPLQAKKLIYNFFYFFKEQLSLQGLSLDLSKMEILYFFKKYSSHTPTPFFSFHNYDNSLSHITAQPMIC